MGFFRKWFGCSAAASRRRKQRVGAVQHPASSGGEKQHANRHLSDQFEFLSICAGESIYGTPLGSAVHDAISLSTTTVNGLRYHPYSSLFGYTIAVAAPSVSSWQVPFDFSVFDKIESEMREWVCRNRESMIVLQNLPEEVQVIVREIEALADEELVIEPMEKLEKLRDHMSHPHETVAEADRYLCLDYLVLDETCHRLRWKYPRVKNVVSLVDTIPVTPETENENENDDLDGWVFEEHQKIKVWTKEEHDGSLSIKCRSVQEQPLFNAISLIYEIDLHPQFMPHLAKATKLHSIPGCGQRTNFLLRYLYKIPRPFANRDTVLFAFACNAMQLDGVNGLIISAQSIPNELKQWWDRDVPPEGTDRSVRENVRGMAFIMRPVGEKMTELTVVANIDKQVSFIPKSLMHWLIKDMIRGLYKNMVHLSENFEKTEFAKRVAANPVFYDWVKHNITIYLNTSCEKNRPFPHNK